MLNVKYWIRRNWRHVGACPNHGFGIALAPVPQEKNASLVYGWGATCGLNGDHPNWLNGWRKKGTRWQLFP